MTDAPRSLRLCVNIFVLSCAVLGAGFEADVLLAAELPPNVVVFLVDDLGARDVGCFGSTFYETPHIDRLAREGMRFTAAYASCPVCSPTRASMMTGRYPQRTGITDFIGAKLPAMWNRNTRLLPAPYALHLKLEERTIAERLRDSGYATFFAGKWHLGGESFLPTDQGFDVNKGGLNWGAPKSYFSPYGNAKLPDGPDGESLTRRLGDEACQFIESHHEAHQDQPFLVYLSFYSVHVPLQAGEKLVEKYKAKAAGLAHKEPAWGKERLNKVRLVQDHPTYAAMIEETDDAVGSVLEKLDALGLTQNAIVLFTSDNGGLSTAEGWSTANAPLRGGKGWMYEGGIRVPSIIRWPGVAKGGSECDVPVISCDYFPTFLEAAGQVVRDDESTTRKIDGVSLLPLLRGEKADRKLTGRPLFWDYPHYGNQGGAPASAVREGKWKVIEWREDGELELFDLEGDPEESHNVANNHREVVVRLSAMLDAWRKEVGARRQTKNPRFDPKQPVNVELPDESKKGQPTKLEAGKAK